MHSYILYFIFAFLAPGSPRTLSDSSEEYSVTLDLQGLQNAAQILNILQHMNERNSDLHAPLRAYKNHRKPQGQPTTRSGIDLDYMGASAEQYIDVNQLLRLVQKNHEANKNSIWKRAEKTPRVYYISNPEILEEYWKNMKKKDGSKPQYGYWSHLKGKDSSQAENYDSRNQFGAGNDKNLLRFIISQRRDGADDKGEDIYVKDNRIENEAISKQRLTNNKVKPKSKDKIRKDKDIGPVSFKSHDDYSEEKKIEKRKPKYNYKPPPKVRGRGVKSSESRNSWKMKKASSYREPVRTSRRYEEPPERSIYSKPKFAKENGRNKGKMGNYGGYQAYGRTPVPFVGKRGIYEDD